MTLRGDTTADLEPTRSDAPLAPRLLLLFSGTAILRKPFVIPLPMGPLTIGRSAVDVHPVLGDDTRMSREHAVVVYDPDTATIHPNLPAPGSGLRWEEFVSALAVSYRARFEN